MGPALRRALARRRRGSRVLLWFVIFLALLAAGQAIIFLPILSRLNRRENPPASREVNLPERSIRILQGTGQGTGEVSLVLKAPLDLPEADDERGKSLDVALFPDGARHRYFLLHAVNPSAEERSVPIGPIVVTDEEGKRYSPVDLAAAVEARGEALPDYLRFYLGVRVPPNGRVDLPPNSTRDFLIAFPEELSPERMAGAVVGEMTLSRREMTKDELDGFLEDPARDRD
ncbi:MAG: hypothetical protein ABFS86_03245 [Planctomycetota bacterium]